MSGVRMMNRVNKYPAYPVHPCCLCFQPVVAEIKASQALVAANRELITRFEKKIQATLDRVWGEEV